MSTADLKSAVTGVEKKADASPKDFPAMLNAWLPEIKRALPKHLNGDRMARIALTAFRRTPKLAECDPRSVFAAVIQAAQLGLEPDTLGRSYLIPYKASKKIGNVWKEWYECQFVPGWKGLVDLMNRSGQGSVYTGVIFDDQTYNYKDGSTRELIVSNETNLVDPNRITHAFAVGHVKGGMFPIIELWRMPKVIAHRDRYNKVGSKHYSHENLEMYARKVVLLQVLKYMPCSAELVAAMSLNDDAEMGRQHIDLKDAIEGVYEPVADDVDEDGVVADDASKTPPPPDPEAVKAAAAARKKPAPKDPPDPAPAADPPASNVSANEEVDKAITQLEGHTDADEIAVWCDALAPEVKKSAPFILAYKARLLEIAGAAS